MYLREILMMTGLKGNEKKNELYVQKVAISGALDYS